jgi:uncharacterized repeat protein (TIGR01451 family)/fimbrial isopeptide formation D2 family protein
LRSLRAVLGAVALGAFAQLATATVLFDNFRGRSGVPGTQVTPNYQNLGSAAKANLIQFAASGTAASSGTANTVDWAYLTTTPAENYDGLCSNLSGHNNSAACQGQWQGKVIYSLIRFPQVGTYQFRVAHDDEAQIDFSSYATAATSANYRNFVYNIPVGSLASYTSNDTSFEQVPGNFVVTQANTCYAMRIYWNNQGGVNHLRLQWIPPGASTPVIVPASSLLDPSSPASYAGCATVQADIGVVKSGPATFDSSSATPPTFQYSIKVWNNSSTGPAASSVTVSDTLPANVTVVGSPTCSASGSATCAGSFSSNSGSAYVLTSGDLPTNPSPASGPTSGSYLTYTFTVRPAAGTKTITNTATVSQTDSNPSNNTSTVTSDSLPIIRLQKSASSNPLVVDVQSNYVLTVQNLGGTNASAPVVINDPIPAGLTLGSLPAGCTTAGQNLQCIVPASSLAAGAAPFTITIPVTPTAAAASTVTNTATASGGGDSSCNEAGRCTATVTNNVLTRADLSIAKTATPGNTYLPGQSLNYTIVVSNSGPSGVVGATISDTVPGAVSVSNWNCIPGNPGASCGPTSSGSGNNVNLTGVNLPSGASVTITITGTAQLGATGTIVNTATVTPPAGATCTQLPCSKSSTVSNTNSGTPALTVTKQASPSSFAVGQTGGYAILVRNSGTTSTSGPIVLTDTMPPGIEILQPVADNVVGSGWDCSASTTTVLSCTTSAVLVPGASAPVVNANVMVGNNTATPAVNTAKVTGGSTACTDQAPCETTIQTNVDRPQLDVKKVLSGTLVLNQQANYIITVTNNGQADTLAGTITDTIPTGLAIGDLTGSGCTASGQVVTCNIPAGKPSGSSMSFTIPVRPTDSNLVGQSVANKAQVNPDTGDSTCPSGSHCTGTTDNPVLAPQLTLTKTAEPGTFTVNQPATYRLTLTNTGTAPTTADTTVTDVIPAGLTVSSATSPCTFTATGSQTTVICPQVAGLAVQASVVFDIVVTPDASLDGVSVTNQATATGGGDQMCPVGTEAASLPARCAPSTTTVVDAPHLKIEKTASSAMFAVGVPANYVLKVTNVGTAPTNGSITVTDLIPSSLTLGTPLQTGCTAPANSQQVTCTITDVLAEPQGGAPGQSRSFSIPVIPKATAVPQVSNTASVKGGGDPVCPINADCIASITTPVNAPSLQVTKTDNGPWVVGQGGAEYTLTVTNASTTVATTGAMTVLDTLPAGIIGVDAVSGDWVCTVSGLSVTCTNPGTGPNGSISAGANSVIVLPVMIESSAVQSGTTSTVTNHASVAGGGDPFNNGNPLAPGSTCTGLDAATPGHCARRDTVVNTPASLAVSKGQPSFLPTGTPGQYTATYVVTVTNAGGAAGSYTLTDAPVFPADVVLNGWSVTASNGGVVNPSLAAVPANGVVHQISEMNLPIGNSVTHSYTVAITFTTHVGVTAVACTGAPGSGAYNEAAIDGSSSSNCGTLPGVPSLSLAKASNGPWAVAQVDARYTLTVTNSGTVATTGTITVNDNLPAGITTSSNTYNGWNCTATGQSLACTNAIVLAPGASASIEFPVTVAAAAVPSVTNNAAVGGGGDPHNGGNPPVPGNCNGDAHCASVTTPVNTQAALGVTKTNGVTKVAAATTTTYTVTITNSGGTDATDLSWTDTVVSGLDKVSIEVGAASAGSVAGSCQGLTCTGITVKAGGSVSYTVTAKVTGSVGSKAVNTASVTGGACTPAAPCTSTDSDDIGAPPEVTPVPVDSRTMLMLLGILLMLAAAAKLRRRFGAGH